jgi:hypothetical protein
MFIPWLALQATALIITVADGVPKLDVTPSCQGAAEAGYIATTADRLKSCVDTEHRTRDKLEKDWSTFAPADRSWCVSSIKGFEPTYSELATCLEMKSALAKNKPGVADPMSAPMTPKPVRSPGGRP